MASLSDGGGEIVPLLLKMDILPVLLEACQSEGLSTLVPALRTLGNLVTGDDETTDEVLAAGALEVLVDLMDHKEPTIRKETCWALSNIAAGSEHHIKEMH